MKTSPRRPLILKRRRLPLPDQNAPGETSEEEPKRPPAQQEPSQVQASKEVAESNPCKFPAGIKIINHPTMPNTQVVAVPNNANIQSIITALTAKGKESGSNGPNKFILISCGGAPTHPPGPQPQAHTSHEPKSTEVITETLGPKSASRDTNLPKPPAALPGRRWESYGTWTARQRGEKPAFPLWWQGPPSAVLMLRTDRCLPEWRESPAFLHPETLTQILWTVSKGLQ